MKVLFSLTMVLVPRIMGENRLRDQLQVFLLWDVIVLQQLRGDAHVEKRDRKWRGSIAKHRITVPPHPGSIAPGKKGTWIISGSDHQSSEPMSTLKEGAVRGHPGLRKGFHRDIHKHSGEKTP